jgi:thioesterase domain-containing protein
LPAVGTVRLIGHSFGGWVVLEMARQLFRSGREAATPILLDTLPPAAEMPLLDRVDVFRRYVEMIEAGGRSLDLPDEVLAATDDEGRLALLHAAMSREGLIARGATLERVRGPLRVFGACLATRYAPEAPWEGPLIVCRAAQGPHSAAEFAERWRAAAPRVRIEEVPGTHLGMLTGKGARQIAALAQAAWLS